jgi:hypothetical protein
VNHRFRDRPGGRRRRVDPHRVLGTQCISPEQAEGQRPLRPRTSSSAQSPTSVWSAAALRSRRPVATAISAPAAAGAGCRASHRYNRRTTTMQRRRPSSGTPTGRRSQQCAGGDTPSPSTPPRRGHGVSPPRHRRGLDPQPGPTTAAAAAGPRSWARQVQLPVWAAAGVLVLVAAVARSPRPPPATTRLRRPNATSHHPTSRPRRLRPRVTTSSPASARQPSRATTEGDGEGNQGNGIGQGGHEHGKGHR